MANNVRDFVYDPDALDYEYDDSEIPLIHPDNSKEFLAKLIESRIALERYNAKRQRTLEEEPYSLNYLMGEWTKLHGLVPPFDANLSMSIEERGSSVDGQLKANAESRIVLETENVKDTEGKFGGHCNNNVSGNGDHNHIEKCNVCALPTNVNNEISDAAKRRCFTETFNCAPDCNVDMHGNGNVCEIVGDMHENVEPTGVVIRSRDSGYHSEASPEISDEDVTVSNKSDMELDNHCVCQNDCSTISMNSTKEFQEDEFVGMPTLEIAGPFDRMCGGDEDEPPILFRYID